MFDHGQTMVKLLLRECTISQNYKKINIGINIGV